MSRRALSLLAVFAIVVAACGGSSDEATEDTLPTNRLAAPGEVADLDDGDQVLTQGILVIDNETRLCELIAESFPPQCAGESAVLGDLPQDDVVALNTDQTGTVKWTSYPLAVVGTIDGGTLVDTQIAGRTYKEESEGLLVRLYTAQQPFFPQPLRSGEAVWWVIDATNVSNQGIPITFGSAQVAEVTISDGDTELYRWSDGKSFAQEVRDVEFEAGRTAGATLTDPLLIDAGTNYTLRAWITGIGADTVIVSAPVEVIQN